MKKLFLFVFMMFACVGLFTSCEKNLSSTNPLEGTLWEGFYTLYNGEQFNLYLEFNGEDVTTWTSNKFYRSVANKDEGRRA